MRQRYIVTLIAVASAWANVSLPGEVQAASANPAGVSAVSSPTPITPSPSPTAFPSPTILPVWPSPAPSATAQPSATPLPSASPSSPPASPSPGPLWTPPPLPTVAPVVPPPSLRPPLTPPLPPAPPPTKPSLAKEVDPPIAVITYGSGEGVTAYSSRGQFGIIGVWKGETVDVVIQYSTAKAGQRVGISALSGGRVIASSSTLFIGSDGLVRFRFQAGSQPGSYTVSLRVGIEESALPFWVLDQDASPGPADLAQGKE